MINKIVSFLRKYNNYKQPEIFINLTYQCPLRCKFCYVNYQNPSQFTKNDLDILFEEGIFKANNIKLITFFGGEPLIKIDLIEYVLKKYYKKCCEKNIHIAIITSMSINYKKYIQLIKEYPLLETVISFDNYAEKRVFSNNKPFKVLEVIDLNELKKYNNNICFHIVIDDEKSLDDLLYVQDLYKKYGILYSWCWNKTPTHYFNFKEKYKNILRNILEEKEYFPKQFTDELSYYLNKNNNGCGMGAEYYISSNGDISPCSISHHNQQFIIMKNGILNEESFENIENAQNNIFNNENCCKCKYKGFCNGGCLIERIKNRNDVNSVNNVLCKIIEELYKTYEEFLKQISNEQLLEIEQRIVEMDMDILGYCYDTGINIDMNQFKKEK